MSASNALNELDLHSKAITPPISSSVISEKAEVSSINSGTNSIIENGRTTRSKSESFAFPGIMNDINSAIYATDLPRKKSTASSIYDEIIGNDLLEPMTKPMTSPKPAKQTSLDTSIDSEKKSNESEEKKNESDNAKKDEIKKSDFVNFFTANALAATTESITKAMEEQISSSPATVVTDTTELVSSPGKKLDTDIKSETESKINDYEKSEAYLELESQCNQFKSVVDNLISKLLSLQRQNDILLKDKTQSQQEIEELKLENTLLKNELMIKNASSTNANTATTTTNNNHTIKENIQNENSYMMNSF